MNDYGRHNLVTQFRCSQCGTVLELTYDPTEKAKKSCEYASTGITGASMVQLSVHIHPCRTCVGTPTQQLEELKTILGKSVEDYLTKETK